MGKIAHQIIGAGLATILIGVSACSSKNSDGTPSSGSDSTLAAATEPSAPPTTAPGNKNQATGSKTYENQGAHFRLQYPADWTPRKDPDYVLAVYPPGAKPGDMNRRLTVDVPSIPPHLPGMITMGKVKDGFLKDLKKQWSNLKVIEDSEQKLPKSKAERIVTTGRMNNQDRTQAALLIIHAERVYILRAESDKDGYPQVKSAWDQMVASLQWTR
jgi:hypothetical protein